MKICLLFAAFAIALFADALFAQSPSPLPTIPDDTVVAKSDGVNITAGEVRHFMETAPPQFAQILQNDPASAVGLIRMTIFLVQQADKMKLADQSPWKDQIQAARDQVLAQAAATAERNNFNVPDADVEAYYERHKADFQSAKIKAIKLDFKLTMPATTPKNEEDLAKMALQAGHAKSERSESDAKTLAADLAKQARSGADFAKLAAQYSDDADSKAAGGDYGSIKSNSPYPAEVKNAVLSLDRGGVTDPLKISASYYVFRVEEKSVLPLNEVRHDILQSMKDQHFTEYLTQLRQRFKATIERPEFFIQPAPQKK